jgi:hypothetical protein
MGKENQREKKFLSQKKGLFPVQQQFEKVSQACL